MSVVTDSITNLQNMTATQKADELKNRTSKAAENDSNMFLTLMLQQLQNQDPTQPTDNTEWLSQLAQYSSLEQMTNMNSGLKDCMEYISAIYGDMTANSEITQTLSMIGKDVTLKIPDEKDPTKFETVTGKVSEASFEDGNGKIKVGDKYYSISNIISIRDNTETNTQAPNPQTQANAQVPLEQLTKRLY